MRGMTLEKMAQACGGELILPYGMSAAPTAEAKGIVLDSREIEEGFLFVATVGERVDGHTFIPQVLERGALGVLCEVVPASVTGPCIVVKDSFAALQDLAVYYRSQLKLPIVGITGSVGKTSTKEMIASVLGQKYRVLKTPMNKNNEVGVPLTMFTIGEEHEIAVLEMGINHFGEMHRLSRMVKPDVVVITNIGECHLEFLGSRDGILKAKSEIFDFIREDGNIFLNGDDDKLKTITDVRGIAPCHFGRNPDNDATFKEVESLGLLGSNAVLCVAGEEISVRVPLPGVHMVYNALVAALVGNAFGLSKKEIQDGIAAVKATQGRSNIIALKNYVLIDDCYNANPVSMETALNLLSQAQGRKVAVLGDMFELGDNEVALHERVGAYATTKTDVLICCGRLSEHMKKGAQAIGSSTEILYFETEEELEKKLPPLLQEGDSVLIKASHGMQFDKIVKLLSKEG